MPSRPTEKEAIENARQKGSDRLRAAILGVSERTKTRHRDGSPLVAASTAAAFAVFEKSFGDVDAVGQLAAALTLLAALQSQSEQSEIAAYDELLGLTGPAAKAAARQMKATHGKDGARVVLDFAAGAVAMLGRANHAVGDLTIRQLAKAEGDGTAFEDLLPDISIQMATYVSAGLAKIRNPQSAPTKAAPPRMRPALHAVAPRTDGVRGFAAAAARKGARPSDAIDDFAQLVADGDGCVSDEQLAMLKIADFSAYLKARDARDKRDKKANGGGA